MRQAGGLGAAVEEAQAGAAAAAAALAAEAVATLVVVARLETGEPSMMMNKFTRIFKHVWFDASDTRRAIKPLVLDRLTQRVSASESRHTGQIRICVEANLPMSYLWRQGKAVSIGELVRQRALMMFSKLRIWDTEQNNGVLVYLLMAEKAIEIVADRGLSRHVPQQEWQAITQRMQLAFYEGRFEDGLTQALEEVSALLVAHFPMSSLGGNVNELPNEPVVQ